VTPEELALIAALGAAVLTAVASLGVVALQERLRNRRAGNDLRRGAYAGLILALDRLDEFCWPLLQTAAAAKAPAPKDVSAAAVAVQEAYVAVLLAGSDRAWKAADRARDAAWDIEDCVKPGGSRTSAAGLTLEQLARVFHKNRRDFIDVARDEMNRP
jgi:hypothetical protein